MSEFAAYQPARPQDLEPRFDPLIEEARRGDLDEVARLSAAREGVGEAESRAAIEGRLARSSSKPRLFVARIDGVVAAFAWVAWLEAESIPTGWYLAGLVVSPALRRRGLGYALTAFRLQWLSARTEAVYYFATILNRATIDLHARLGFREVARGITVPGCSFTGGIGALYRLGFRGQAIKPSDGP